MAIPPKPTVRTLPPAPDVADQATFNDRANIFVPELPPWADEVNALATWTGDRATDAATAQGAAEDARDGAQEARGDAEDARDAAEGWRDEAQAWAEGSPAGGTSAQGWAGVAEGFKDSAETAAAAAGAAAGLPSLAGNAGSALVVNAQADGVLWQEVNLPRIGEGQTWQSVLESRSASTSYQNTTGRAIGVSVYGFGSTFQNQLQVSADNVTWVEAARVGSQGSGGGSVFSIVPPNHFYRVLASTITQWSELR